MIQNNNSDPKNNDYKKACLILECEATAQGVLCLTITQVGALNSIKQS